MRLWSIHPKYLDSVGLTACWREGLLAKKVLAGGTEGYKNHPQLLRFKQCPDPLQAIDSYLSAILDESIRRGYKYDASKVTREQAVQIMSVTKDQLQYEFEHLKKKLSMRNHSAYGHLMAINDILPNPLFFVTEGEIEKWEVIK